MAHMQVGSLLMLQGCLCPFMRVLLREIEHRREQAQLRKNIIGVLWLTHLVSPAREDLVQHATQQGQE